MFLNPDDLWGYMIVKYQGRIAFKYSDNIYFFDISNGIISLKTGMGVEAPEGARYKVENTIHEIDPNLHDKLYRKRVKIKEKRLNNLLGPHAN